MYFFTGFIFLGILFISDFLIFHKRYNQRIERMIGNINNELLSEVYSHYLKFFTDSTIIDKTLNDVLRSSVANTCSIESVAGVVSKMYCNNTKTLFDGIYPAFKAANALINMMETKDNMYKHKTFFDWTFKEQRK